MIGVPGTAGAGKRRGAASSAIHDTASNQNVANYPPEVGCNPDVSD